MAIRYVIFDLGGVLIDFNVQRMLDDNIPPEYHKAVMNATFKSDEWQMMDAGEIEVEEAVRIMNGKLPGELHDSVFDMILNRKKQMPPIKEMTSVIEALYQKGYTLYVLSNCAKWFPVDFPELVPASDKFSGYVISADHHTLKPQEEIYKILFDKFNLKPSECFFIDDSEANIRTAQKLGMTAHCFYDRDFSRLENAMKKAGIILY